MTYFEFYEIPVSFFPNKAELRNRYLEFSKKFHPDVFQEGDEQSALEKTAFNNTAYSTLNSEDKLVQYILNELYPNSEKITLPPAFLMEMMEKNEALMEAKMEGSEGEIAIIKEEILKEQAEIKAKMMQCKEQFSLENIGILDQLRVLDLKHNYIKRILKNTGV